jgi:hypothetical protein
MSVNAMNLKHVLRQVQAYPNDLHGHSPRCSSRSTFDLAGRAGSIPLAPAVQEESDVVDGARSVTAAQANNTRSAKLCLSQGASTNEYFEYFAS